MGIGPEEVLLIPGRTQADRRRALHGWGRTSASVASVRPAGTDADLIEQLWAAGSRGVLARGLGRSYGDAAQNAGGVVLDMTARDQVLGVDIETGVVTAEAGVSLDALIRRLAPLGLSPVVAPGTRQATLGGAVAADVHGKNHHVDGGFGNHLVSLDLLCADGTVRQLTPSDEVFWATVGGMGLTGLILRVTLRTRRIETAFCVVDTDRCDDLDQLLQRMGDDARYTYSVAWVDCLASGPKLGRSVLTRGWDATLDQLPASKRGDPLAFVPSRRVAAPSWAPNGVLNRWTVGAFNEARFRRSPASRRGELRHRASFLQPLDAIDGWNRIYGPAGFLQYQFAVPLGAEDTVRRCLQMVSDAGQGCFLAVLKRLGATGRGHLSFPMPGWTLTLDMPAQPPVAALLDRLDEQVLQAGGRIYLAKDSRMPSSAVPAMYPRLQEWRTVRRLVDPAGVFTSDLARRLRL